MRKNIGKEGTKAGEFDVFRLCSELDANGVTIDSFDITTDTSEIYLTFDDRYEATVTDVCSKHVPKPLPIELTEAQQTQVALVEEIEKGIRDRTELQLAIAEIVELIKTK